MKKIALLFTIMSVGALSGMEVPESEIFRQEGLPMDLKRFIVSLVGNFRDVKDAVRAIAVLSHTNTELNTLINGHYGGFENQQGFTKLVHILADSYGLTTVEVAEKFDTPIATEYIALVKQLDNAVASYQKQMGSYKLFAISAIDSAIKQGVDVNYSSPTTKLKVTIAIGPSPWPTYFRTPLEWAIEGRHTDLVKKLLAAGAKIESDDYYDKRDVWQSYNDAENTENKKLLNLERKKQQK